MNLPVENQKTLILVEPENRSVSLAARNLSQVQILPINTLNVVALLQKTNVLVSKDGIDLIVNLYKRT